MLVRLTGFRAGAAYRVQMGLYGLCGLKSFGFIAFTGSGYTGFKYEGLGFRV